MGCVLYAYIRVQPELMEFFLLSCSVESFLILLALIMSIARRQHFQSKTRRPLTVPGACNRTVPCTRVTLTVPLANVSGILLDLELEMSETYRFTECTASNRGLASQLWIELALVEARVAVLLLFLGQLDSFWNVHSVLKIECPAQEKWAPNLTGHYQVSAWTCSQAASAYAPAHTHTHTPCYLLCVNDSVCQCDLWTTLG